ncbi:MAG: hypothetical protein ACREDR_12315 [Blastocatellia bacterium]
MMSKRRTGIGRATKPAYFSIHRNWRVTPVTPANGTATGSDRVIPSTPAPCKLSAREQRGLEIARKGGIIRVGGAYIVPASTPGHSPYTVQGDLSGCNCPDSSKQLVWVKDETTGVSTRKHQICKHCYAVRFALELGTIAEAAIEHTPSTSAGDPFAGFDQPKQAATRFPGT